jgi:TolB-like protein
VVTYGSGDTGSTRWALRLEPCRHIHYISVYVSPVGYRVTHVNANPKADARSAGWSPSWMGTCCWTLIAQRTAPSALSKTKRRESPPVLAPRLSLVVLPFTNLGGDTHDDYLADAITEDLTADLSRLPGALVIARHSAATYKDKRIDIRRVGEELGVRYVVEGSVRKLDEILRVNVQLVSTETNTHVWAGRFDQNVTDLGAGQEEIVSRLRAVLGLQMLDAESARSVRERPDNPDVSDLLLRGLSTLRGAGPSQWQPAAALFEQALALDRFSVGAMCHLVDLSINAFVIPDYPTRGNEELLARAASLVAAAVNIEPESDRVLSCRGSLALMRHVQEGLRLAGLRDHADEYADFGVVPDSELHSDLIALTPTTVPGAKTIRTGELASLLEKLKPLLIDVALDSWGKSIPGAIGLQGTGHGAIFSDDLQARFDRKISVLTNGDRMAPIVAFCVNSDRFSGYNLALRLVALGYSQVYWYRGGVEAWEVNDMPESDLVLQDW